MIEHAVLALPARRGILTVDDLKVRCTIDPVKHCWIWQGACTRKGHPRIWTLDYRRIEKRVMSGPLAAWHIAFQAPPRDGHLVFRGCQNIKCLNPAHLREARDKAAIGLHIRRLGSRIGTATESRLANIKLAQIALGMTPTPSAIVLAVRAADPKLTNRAVGMRFGISHSTVSAIRRGVRRAGVVA